MSDLKLVLGEINDFDTAFDIILNAKAFLKAQGIDQWQSGYPNDKSIIQDLENKKGFFIEYEGNKVGYLCLDFDGESTYNDIDGKWSLDKDYSVVHRMAISPKARGLSLSSKAFLLCEKESKARGVDYMRVDTHTDNKIMQKTLAKCGFKYCGTIIYDDGPKIAFDKSF